MSEETYIKEIEAVRLKSNLQVKAGAVRFLLKEWNIKQTFWNAHRIWLERQGLEIPTWEIMKAQK